MAKNTTIIQMTAGYCSCMKLYICLMSWYSLVLTAEHQPPWHPHYDLWVCFWAVPLACVCWYKWLPNTFMSSRFAGKTPGLRFDRELFGRVGAEGSGGGGGALGKDTMMEVGRLPALLLWPSATGLQREHRINVLFKRSVLSQETASFIVWKRHS